MKTNKNLPTALSIALYQSILNASAVASSLFMILLSQIYIAVKTAESGKENLNEYLEFMYSFESFAPILSVLLFISLITFAALMIGGVFINKKIKKNQVNQQEK